MQKVINSSIQESRSFTNEIKPSATLSNKSNSIDFNYIKILSLGLDSVATLSNGFKIVLSESLAYVKSFAEKVKTIEQLIINDDVMENEDFVNELLKEAIQRDISIRKITINVVIETVGKMEPSCVSINQRLYQKVIRVIGINYKTLKRVVLKFNGGSEILVERHGNGNSTNLVYGYDSSFGVFSKLIYPVFKAFKAGNSKAFTNFFLTLDISKKESLHLQRIFQAFLEAKQRLFLSNLTITSPNAIDSVFITNLIKDSLSTITSYKNLNSLTFNFPQFNGSLEDITSSLKSNVLPNCSKIINANKHNIIFV
uniref:Ppx-GppA domain-containing protein n=1 Tax=Strongyloides papillosus TaxID=174720 RepID=A0A0N5CE45_STREA